jgi:Sulfotransferase family
MDRDGPVFITGLDRSGKTRLRRLLGAHPDLHLVRRTALWSAGDDRNGDLADGAALDRRLEWLRSDPRTGELVAEADGWAIEFERGPRTPPRLYAAMYAARASLHGKRRWGEQDAEIERHADRVLRMLPSARIVHLVRDPRRRFAAVLAGERRRAGRLGSITASWIASARRGTALANRYPRRYRLVRAEDLDERPRAELERIHEFLALSMTTDILDRWSTQPAELPELRRAEVTFIEAWAGPTMRTMGYPASGRRTSIAAWNPLELAGFAARSLREARSNRPPQKPGAAE